jgi:hypothetical protein
MILQDHRLPRHARRFLQQHARIVGVVQHIDEADDVEALVGMRDRLAVEDVDGNMGGAPGRIRTPDPLIRSQVLYPAELPVREGGV